MGIREILNTGKYKSTYIHLKEHSRTTDDPLQISNTLNHFFTNVGRATANNVLPGSHHWSYILKNVSGSVLLMPTNPAIAHFIIQLNFSKAVSPNSVPVSFSKF